MDKKHTPWIYKESYDPHYYTEQEEVTETTEELESTSEPETNYPFNKDILY